MIRRNRDQRLKDGRYRRWVDIDPEQGKVWRYAWDLLLEDKPDRTLDDICKALHERGYRLRTGVPFVKIMPDGTKIHNERALSRAFHNPFYAGLIYLHEHFDETEYQVVKGDCHPRGVCPGRGDPAPARPEP